MITQENNSEITLAILSSIKEKITEAKESAKQAQAAGKKVSLDSIINLEELVNTLNPDSFKAVSLPDNFNEQLSELGSFVGFKDAKKIGDLLNSQVEAVKKKNDQSIAKQVKEALAVMKKTPMKSQVLHSLTKDFDIEGNPIFADVRFDKALDLLQAHLLQGSKFSSQKIKVTKINSAPVSSELQNNLDILKKQAYSKDSNYLTSSLRANLPLITTSLVKKEQTQTAIKLAESVTSMISTASAESSEIFDASKALNILDNIRENYQNTLDQVNKKLEGFDLSSIIETIAKNSPEIKQDVPEATDSTPNIIDTAAAFEALAIKAKKKASAKEKKNKAETKQENTDTKTPDLKPSTLEGQNFSEFLERTGEFTQTDANTFAFNFEEYMQDPKYRETMSFLDFLNKIKGIELGITQAEALNTAALRFYSKTDTPQA